MIVAIINKFVRVVKIYINITHMFTYKEIYLKNLCVFFNFPYVYIFNIEPLC